jgi:dTMP kinase
MERGGMLIAFEGLDQSGKQTQAGALGAWLRAGGREVRLASFPDYETPIGREIGRALAGGREFGPDVMQLLYVANRYEWKPEITRALARGAAVVCDRYVASSVAYGEAHGLDPGWLTDVQRFLPPADLTILLDIAPDTAVRRKATGRDRFERDLALLARVRDSYRRQARQPAWALVDGERSRDAVRDDIIALVSSRFGPP